MTTWGDPNLDDPGAIWPIDPETEVTFPDLDGDDLTKWLPIPEEVPQDLLEPSLEDLEFAEQADEPFSDEPRPVSEAPIIRLDVSAADAPRASGAIEAPQQVEVAVEQKPEPQFAIAPVAAEATMEAETAAEASSQAVNEAPAPIAAPATGSIEVAAAERDEDELREIEAGLAKFKRCRPAQSTERPRLGCAGKPV